MSEPTLYDVAAARLEAEAKAANPYVPPLPEILAAEEARDRALWRMVDACRVLDAIVRGENAANLRAFALEAGAASREWTAATEALARLRGVPPRLP